MCSEEHDQYREDAEYLWEKLVNLDNESAIELLAESLERSAEGNL